MEVLQGTATAIRFGHFELDVRSRELRKGDARIRLQDQPFEILHLMLQRPGDVVTREELCKRLWPNGTYVDFEHSLNAAVKRLRAALGDDADNPQFVETLPRRGYRFIASLQTHDTSAPATASTASAARLVVLPFASLSDDPAHEYFSDGLTEELINQLGPLCRGRINVIARRSSMAFKGTTQRACEIARALTATYLLEGSVRRDGTRVRITVRLIEGHNETQLWSDTHDRTLDDWLSVQADVAAHVARSLMLELSPRHTPQPIPEPHAHQAYLRARYHWARPADEGLEDALRCLDEALRVAPDFAAALGALARIKVGAAEYGRDLPRRAFEAAREAASRAVALEPATWEARVVLADLCRLVDYDWQQAKARYQEVLAANPSSELAHRGYAFLLAVQGRHDDAIRAADLARELDPLCLVPSLTCAWTRYMAGRYDDAIEACHHTIDMGPTYAPALRLLALAHLQQGNGSEAAALLERAMAQVGDHPLIVTALAHVCGSLGRRAEAAALITALREVDASSYVSRYHVALAHAGSGDLDAAFDALEFAYRDRDPNLAHVVIEPRFEALRADARFALVLDRLKLTRLPSIARTGEVGDRAETMNREA
jgi:TolB-like protein/tetratricopeptide (TPR) repeat protein